MVSKAETAEIRELLTPTTEEPEATDATEVAEVTDDAELESSEGAEEDTGAGSDDLESETEDDADAGDKTYTPTELAEEWDWELDDVYSSIIIPLDEDGGESIPLGEIKNKYQNMAREVTQLQTQLTEAQSGLEQAQAGGNQAQQLSNAMIEQVGYLNQIQAAEKNTDWKELEELDPTEAVLKRDKIRRARDEVNAEMDKLQQQEKQAQQQYLTQAHTKMMELIPEWKDAEVMKKDQSNMQDIARTFDFNDNEIATIADPRLMKLLRRLSYLEGKDKQASSAVSKVRGAPRALKGRKVEPATDKSKVEALTSKAKQSGNKNDVHNAIKALLKQGLKQG